SNAVSVTDSIVTVASPAGIHPRNAQNEPALAVDASRPSVLAAGANELVDMQPCSEAASTTADACSFPLGTFNLGVGLTGVYFSTIATNLTDTPIERSGIKSNFALTVSHIDNVTAARIQVQSNWSRPYFVPAKISPTAGLDKEQIWADNAASSPFFGNVYVC